MLNTVSRRLFLSAGLSSVAAGLSFADLAFAGAPEGSLRPRLRGSDFHKRAVQGPESIVAEAKLGGRVAYAVADAKTGVILEGSNETVGVAPASVTKAITALYALDTLGAGHRFRTQIIATGGVSNGVVGGDLVLVGGGDPTLDTNALADLARRLKAAGIREVRGGFKVYDGTLPFVSTIDKDQPDHVGYSPAVSGVALNFNRVHFEWRRASGKYSVSMDARTDKYRPEVSMATMRIAQRSLPVYGYNSSKGIDSWTVARSALGGGGSRWLPVRNPGLYAGDVFRTLAASQGIRLRGAKVVRQAPKGRALAEHRSAPLNDIVRDMLKFSNNLVAEMVGLSASRKAVGKVSGLKASAKHMNAWARKALGVQGLALVDHSGLGAANRMTAMAMAQSLVKVYGAGQLQPLLKPIALRDAQGRVQKNHPIKVRAKTGTLNFVSALAGYMQAPDGRELVFAVFAEDQKTRARITKANREAPQGGRSWNRRAKKMQQKMIERWGTLYGS